MIQTILLDLFIHFFCGQAIALSARNKIKTMPAWNRYLLQWLAVSVITFLPFAYYYIFYFHDWSWMYFAEHATFPFSLSLLMPEAYLLSGAAGFCAAQKLIKKDALRASLLLCAFSGALISGMTLALWKRFYYVGTTEQFLSGKAVPFLETPLLPVILAMGFIFIPAFVFLLIRNMRET